jgi:hypothetical protein
MPLSINGLAAVRGSARPAAAETVSAAHLIDLASTYMRAADALAPLPPAKPEGFSK